MRQEENYLKVIPYSFYKNVANFNHKKYPLGKEWNLN